MKVRTEIELQDFLDEALVYRKRELSMFYLEASRAGASSEGDFFRRAAVLLLYSHWEGYFREASIAYLRFAFQQLPRAQDLSIPLLVTAFKNDIIEIGRSRKTIVNTPVIQNVVEQLDRPLYVNVDSLIDTESNLSSSVLAEILFSVGIDSEYWSTKSHFIDYQLLKTRNEIAHGNLLRVNETEYSELHSFVIESLEHFKSDIELNVNNKAYKRSAA